MKTYKVVVYETVRVGPITCAEQVVLDADAAGASDAVDALKCVLRQRGER